MAQPTPEGIPPGLIFTLIALIAVPILWLCRHMIAHGIRDSAGRRQAQFSRTNSEERWKSANAENDAEREQQLAALNAALPKTPPERMRVTIHFNRFKAPCTEHQYYQGHSATVQTGIATRHTVDMFLEFSEVERGIIREHNLADIVIEDKAAYTPEQLQEMEYQATKQAESVRGLTEQDFLQKEIIKQSLEFGHRLSKSERTRIRFGDFMVAPFSRDFDTPHEATLYGSQLKTHILPAMKKLLDQYRQHKQAETIEF
jgi:hypothetical protein